MEMSNVVHVVDDDEGVRRTIARIVRDAGYTPREYCSGDAFLAEAQDAEPGCVVLDIRMPGTDGLGVQEQLGDRQAEFPVLILTGHADVDSAVGALKGGAVDFLRKPFRKQQLVEAIGTAQRRLAEGADQARRQKEARALVVRLSPREAETLELLRQGLPHKLVAHQLGISIRTVEVHRSNIMRKLEVRSLSEALEILFASQ